MLKERLKTLVLLDKEKNYTKTAKLLNISQPAVSQHIKSLEDDYNIIIFKRTGKELKTTKEGEILIKNAKRLLAIDKNIDKELLLSTTSLRKVDIGITLTASGYFIPELLNEFKEKYSEIRYNFHTDISENIFERLKYHELDFGYTKTPWGYGDLSHEPYNNGESINRGTVRFVYSASTYEGERGAKYIPVEHRHVFLTFNHYNDFVEYLNYEGGWGAPFGWMTAGHEYVAGMKSSVYGPGYYEFDDPYPPSKYPVPEVLTLNELQNILNVM